MLVIAFDTAGPDIHYGPLAAAISMAGLLGALTTAVMVRRTAVAHDTFLLQSTGTDRRQ